MEQVVNPLDLYRSLSELARRYQFRNRDEVCCYGLTVSQCYALQALQQRQTLTSSALAYHLNLDLSSTTRLIDRLVRKKLVARTRSGADARVKEVSITPAGERLISRIDEEFAQMLSASLVDLPSDVQAAIPEVLRRLTRVLSCGPDNSCKPLPVNIRM
jgi:MarR family 2-MHQ and catechol resistance regulon transcriptional repressor